jgi:hypothetical protein
MTSILPLDGLDPRRFDTPAILKRLASASRSLAPPEAEELLAST